MYNYVKFMFHITGMAGACLFFICHNENRNSHYYGLLDRISYKKLQECTFDKPAKAFCIISFENWESAVCIYV